MRIALAVVMALTIGVLGAIAFASGGAEQECSSCHGSERLEGRYRFERPRVDILVPENVSARETFQVLVMIEDPPEYDLVSPAARVRYSSELSGETIPLIREGMTWTGVLRVVGSEGSNSSMVIVEYTVNHDHSAPEHPDLATYSVEKGLSLQGKEDTNEGGVRESPIGTALLLLAPLAGWMLWGRKRL